MSHFTIVCHVFIQVGLIPEWKSKLRKKETDCRMAGDPGLHDGDAPMPGKCVHSMNNNMRGLRLNKVRC